MRVELDMFSGRPNPIWDLDEAAERELLELESNLEPVGRAADEPPPLGYRGFIYSDDSGGRRVFDGVLTKGGQRYKDSDYRIERLLFASIPSEWSMLRDSLPERHEP